MRPRIFNPADHDACIDLLLDVYSHHHLQQICPPREIAEAYFAHLTGQAGAHTFVYEIHDKVYAVCTGIILKEENESGQTINRFYVKDLFSHYRTQKKVHIVERLIRFGKDVLQQNNIIWIEDKRDFFKYRTNLFRELGYETCPR
jgi:hypothetical protein